jgi:glycosyltransferase involved in cell wall biosynthesis
MTLNDLIQVDIVTIVRNAADTILKTLDSISNQSYPHIHHIIIDGNSKDDTISIIEHYNHSKKKTISHQNGRGIANAFNEGIRKTSGNLVIFLNSGDTLFDNSIISKIVESYNKVQWEWACGETISVSRRGHLKRHVKQHSSWKHELFFYGNPVCHQSAIFSKKHLNAVGFYDENLALEMDFDYNIRSALIADPHLLYFPISCYDISGVSSLEVFKVNTMHREVRRKYFELDMFSDFLVESKCLLIAFKRFLMIPLKILL